MRSILLLLLIFVATILLQVPIARQVSLPFYDEAAYLDFSRGIVETGLPSRSINKDYGDLTFRHPPLMRYVTAGALVVFGDSLLTGRMIASFCSLLILALLFHWIRQRTNGLYALVFSLVLATHSLFLIHAHSLYVEVPLTLLCLSGLICLLEYVKQSEEHMKRQWLTYSGALLGAALCSKYTAIFYILPIFIYLAVVRRNLKHTILFTCVCSSFLLIWFSAAALVDLKLLVHDLFSIQDIVGGQKKSANATLTWFLTKDFLPSFGASLLALPLPLALAVWLRPKKDRVWLFKPDFLLSVSITLLSLLVTILVSYKRTRYIVPILPLYIFAVAIATFEIGKYSSTPLRQKLLPWVVFLILLMTTSPLFDLQLNAAKKFIGRPRSFSGTYSQSLQHDIHYQGVREIAAQLAKRADEDDLIHAKWNIAVQLHYLTGIPYCLDEPCKQAQFVLLPQPNSTSYAGIASQLDDINQYQPIKTYDKLGSWLEPLTLYERKEPKLDD